MMILKVMFIGLVGLSSSLVCSDQIQQRFPIAVAQEIIPVILPQAIVVPDHQNPALPAPRVDAGPEQLRPMQIELDYPPINCSDLLPLDIAVCNHPDYAQAKSALTNFRRNVYNHPVAELLLGLQPEVRAIDCAQYGQNILLVSDRQNNLYKIDLTVQVQQKIQRHHQQDAQRRFNNFRSYEVFYQGNPYYVRCVNIRGHILLPDAILCKRLDNPASYIYFEPLESDNQEISMNGNFNGSRICAIAKHHEVSMEDNHPLSLREKVALNVSLLTSIAAAKSIILTGLSGYYHSDYKTTALLALTSCSLAGIAMRENYFKEIALNKTHADYPFACYKKNSVFDRYTLEELKKTQGSIARLLLPKNL